MLLATELAALDELDKLDELVVAGLDELELELVLLFTELVELLLEVTVPALDEELLVAVPSTLNQLILKPPVSALIPKLWPPAVSFTVAVTSTHFCHPPVAGTVTVPSTSPVAASVKLKLPPFELAIL